MKNEQSYPFIRFSEFTYSSNISKGSQILWSVGSLFVSFLDKIYSEGMHVRMIGSGLLFLACVAEGVAEVDVLLTIGVPDAAAFAFDDDGRFLRRVARLL